MTEKREFCKYCPFHRDVKLIHTELEDGASKTIVQNVKNCLEKKYDFTSIGNKNTKF